MPPRRIHVEILKHVYGMAFSRVILLPPKMPVRGAVKILHGEISHREIVENTRSVVQGRLFAVYYEVGFAPVYRVIIQAVAIFVHKLRQPVGIVVKMQQVALCRIVYGFRRSRKASEQKRRRSAKK